MSFITDFSSWVGETECPEIYFKYSAIALVAACLSSRVTLSRQIGSRVIKIPPNLYTLLLGPSGNGKSLAVSSALTLLRRHAVDDFIHLYAGKMTAPAMYETMRPTDRAPNRASIWVVNDELSNDIGMGEYADQFVKSLTRMYLGEEFNDTTVTRGQVVVKAPYCVNWTACTMREWLQTSIRRDAILGGFFARTVVVEAGYTGKRVRPDAPIPASWDYLDMKLTNEVGRLLRMEGEFIRSPEATEWELEWYMSRPPLTDAADSMAPTEHREYSLMLKFAQILSASESASLVIELHHMQEAIKLVTECSRNIPEIADFVSRGPRAHLYKEIEMLLMKAGALGKDKLTALAYRKGIQADELSKLLNTWVEAQLVEMKPNGGGIQKVIWKSCQQ